MRRYVAWWVEAASTAARRPEILPALIDAAAPDPDVRADLVRGWGIVERALAPKET